MCVFIVETRNTTKVLTVNTSIRVTHLRVTHLMIYNLLYLNVTPAFIRIKTVYWTLLFVTIPVLLVNLLIMVLKCVFVTNL